MSRMHYYLKTETKYYQASEKEIKTFELRKNDKNFQIGDIIHLVEIVDGVTSGRQLPPKEIIYIFRDFDILDDLKHGLKHGYCILQLRGDIKC